MRLGRRLLKCREAAEKSGIDEVEYAPQVAHPVLDRRSREREPTRRRNGTQRAALPRAGVLDGLRLVRDDSRERQLAKPLKARELYEYLLIVHAPALLPREIRPPRLVDTVY